MVKCSMAFVPMQILTVISLGYGTATCLFPIFLLSNHVQKVAKW